MADVGRLAKVSAQTVSRYFTGTGYVGAETRVRIEAAIAELGYRPNQSARTLRVDRSDSVGVLSVGPDAYGSSTILAGLSAAARKADFSLIISQLDLDLDDPKSLGEVRRALDRFMSSQVDGIVVSTPYMGTEDLLDHIWETLPVTTVSARPQQSADSVTADSYEAGLLATGHLAGLGHRRILHIAGPENRNESYERERGYRDALATAGLEPLPVLRGDWSASSGYEAGRVADLDSFTGVFAGNDQMALGFMSSLRSRGRVAPDDFSIVGTDDMPDARYFVPPLTSVYLNFAALGEAAFSIIHHRIETGERLDRQVIAPELVVRDSTSPWAGNV